MPTQDNVFPSQTLPTLSGLLREGSRGAEVEEAQRWLKQLGFHDGALDGIFGPRTAAAVRAFQSAFGLSVDGLVGPRTWARLFEATREPGGSGPLLRLGDRGEAVRTLQARLGELGFQVGAADGIFGPQTGAAVRDFQRSRGLTVDGIAGPATWRALGVHVQPPEEPAPEELISQEQLQAIMRNLAPARATECLPHLNAAMAEADITTPQRCAAFLAQLAHESGELKYFEELGSGEAYEGREDLGNIHPGDGPRFKGRGPIQLTGRYNYRAAGTALGLDLEGNPERAADVDVGFRVAGWYWTSRGLNGLADAGDFREITRRINGGYNGLEHRERYYQRARGVLLHCGAPLLREPHRAPGLHASQTTAHALRKKPVLRYATGSAPPPAPSPVGHLSILRAPNTKGARNS